MRIYVIYVGLFGIAVHSFQAWPYRLQQGFCAVLIAIIGLRACLHSTAE